MWGKGNNGVIVVEIEFSRGGKAIDRPPLAPRIPPPMFCSTPYSSQYVLRINVGNSNQRTNQVGLFQYKFFLCHTCETHFNV